MEEPGRFQLGGDLLDGPLHVGGFPRASADGLPTPEQEDHDLGLVDPVHEAGELLRPVLGPAEDAGDRLKVELLPEGGRGNDIFNLELRRGNTTEGRSVVTAPASTRLR